MNAHSFIQKVKQVGKLSSSLTTANCASLCSSCRREASGCSSVWEETLENALIWEGCRVKFLIIEWKRFSGIKVLCKDFSTGKQETFEKVPKWTQNFSLNTKLPKFCLFCQEASVCTCMVFMDHLYTSIPQSTNSYATRPPSPLHTNSRQLPSSSVEVNAEATIESIERTGVAINLGHCNYKGIQKAFVEDSHFPEPGLGRMQFHSKNEVLRKMSVRFLIYSLPWFNHKNAACMYMICASPEKSFQC